MADFMGNDVTCRALGRVVHPQANGRTLSSRKHDLVLLSQKVADVFDDESATRGTHARGSWNG